MNKMDNVDIHAGNDGGISGSICYLCLGSYCLFMLSRTKRSSRRIHCEIILYYGGLECVFNIIPVGCNDGCKEPAKAAGWDSDEGWDKDCDKG